MQRFSVAARHDSEPSCPFVPADFFLRLIRSRILQVCALAIFLSFVCGFSILAQAQSNSLTDAAADRAWQITSYAVEAGLGAQRVFDIAFESDGTAWLAAADGLRRFDGFTWERFDTNSSLPSTFARAVEVTRAGELWVGSDAGAGVFDARQRRYDPRGAQTGLANTNVRQIVEDAGGTLWFSCDQWPETSVRSGGLSQLRSGVWKTFGRADGIPMDYVIGYFRDSQARQFALTPQGWAQWQGDKWGTPSNRGYEQEGCVLHMAEAGDGTLFAQGERLLLALRNNKWQEVDRQTALVMATRKGEIIAVCRDDARGLLWFSVWNGERFVRASAVTACLPGARLYRLREAPDGSVWCVGHGTVARWARSAGPWTLYPNLPRPVTMDTNQCVWFAGGGKVVVWREGQFELLPWRRFFTVDRAGTAIGLSADKGRLAVTNFGAGVSYPVASVPFESVESVHADASEGFWLIGEVESGERTVVHLGTNGVQLVSGSEFKDRNIFAVTVDPEHGFWVVGQLRTDGTKFELGYLRDNQVQWLSAEAPLPPLMYPNLTIGAGASWIRGYAALYRGPLAATGPWQLVTDFPDTSFESALGSADEVLFNFTGGRTGKPGCALYTRAGWQVAYGDYTRMWAGAEGTIYLAGRGGCYLRRQPGTLDLDFLALPNDSFVSAMASGREGTLWVGTSEGVLQYQPTRTPPDTLIESQDVAVRGDNLLHVTFAGRQRFDLAARPDGYHYSWKFDDAEWSPFQNEPTPALALTELTPGSHRLLARARDVDGNVDPTPAELSFVVQPIPLQQHAWFGWAVGLVAVVIGGLSWLGIQRSRQIALSNAALRDEVATRREAEAALQKARDELEHRVAERTSELVQANVSLSREIAERQQAQQNQQRLEEQLRQSQKMEAVGTLAGGIAHDFNNILAVIIPYSHFALEESADRPQMQEYLRQILAASDRAKNLVQQVLAFSRRQRQERQMIDPQPIIKEALKLLRSALPSTIEIVPDLQPTPPVLADPTQIHQVLMNLCTNAEHAMRGKPGRLEIRLDTRRVDEAFAREHHELRVGEYVRLSVRDAGCGMTPELLARVFEPFFTTKAPGQGTGLGLAVVHGIVKSHDGAILVQSELNRGTEFQIYLPAQTPAPAVPAAPATPAKPVLARGQGQHILLVDDEPAVANAVGRLLTQTGYRVTVKTSSPEAWQVFRAQPQEFDLLFTDLTMPGMTGVELAQQVHALRPELPVLMATGFGGDVVAEAMIGTGIRKVLQKPLTPILVTESVHALLVRG
jgi:signal transduction histidine kinase/BarA-like signal transduction histidine kinase